MKKKWFQFSEDDREAIQDLLKDYDLGKVKSFIKDVEERINLDIFLKEAQKTEIQVADYLKTSMKYLGYALEEVDPENRQDGNIKKKFHF